ncbi:hypothetical protein CHUAL_006923 [Chamberlinius hualienensis]
MGSYRLLNALNRVILRRPSIVTTQLGIGASHNGHSAAVHATSNVAAAFGINSKQRTAALGIQSVVPVGSHSAKVIFSDDRTCDFKFIWLRDNCNCTSCVHPDTNQKTLDTPTLDVNIRPKQLTVLSSGELLVEWPGDHRSIYGANWLHKYGQCFAQDSFDIGSSHGEGFHLRPPIQLWDRTKIWKFLPEISYREVMDSDEGLKTWLEMIHKYGLAIMRGVPTKKNEVINVVNRFAYVKETSYGITFDVISEPDPGAHLAYTGLRLELHTDMNYREKSPGLQLLHCLKGNDRNEAIDEGHQGRSFFVDGFHVAKWLQSNQPAAFHVLSSTPIKFSITSKNLKYSQHWPIICVDKDGEVTEIHCNNRTMGPLQAPSHLVLAFYHAYKLFTEKLRELSLELVFQMQPGDLVAFNNRRVLHGRTEFDPKYIQRHLQGCYVDIDEAMSKYDLLLSRQLPK